MEPDHLRDDLKMEVALIICEIPDEKLFKLYEDKVLEFYTVRIILNLIRSNTSPFYKKYRQQYIQLGEQEIIDDYDYTEHEAREQLEDIALEEIDNLYWYDAELIRLYQKKGNFRAIEKETGIPFVSCFNTLKENAIKKHENNNRFRKMGNANNNTAIDHLVDKVPFSSSIS